MAATGAGTPRWRSTNRLIVGPSFSRKKMLKRVNERKKTSEVSPSMPSATPLSRVVPAPETALLTSWVVPEVPFASASLTQPSMVLRAWSAARSISDDCSTIPPTTSRKTPAAIARSARSISPAPAARGTRWRPSHVTPGVHTAATTAPATTGVTIDEVRPRIQTSPARTAPIPTTSHDVRPSARSQRGASKTRDRTPGGSSTAASAGAGRSARRRRMLRMGWISPSASRAAGRPARPGGGAGPRAPRGFSPRRPRRACGARSASGRWRPRRRPP